MTTTTDTTTDDRMTLQRLFCGGNLRDIRERHGLTAEALGHMVGATCSAVCRWERGDRLPRPRHMLRLVVALEQLRAQGSKA